MRHFLVKLNLFLLMINQQLWTLKLISDLLCSVYFCNSFIMPFIFKLSKHFIGIKMVIINVESRFSNTNRN